MGKVASLRQAVTRYGWLQAVRAAVLNNLSRLVEFELCVLLMNSGKPYNFPVPKDINVQLIESFDQFRNTLHPDISLPDYAWAFARGDQCVANIVDDAIVGYGFGTSLPTQVVDGIEFYFPEWCNYGYASFTSPAFRGQRLAMYRWPESQRQKLLKHEYLPRDVYYINLANSASLKSDLSDGVYSLRLGYALWVRLGKKRWCWNSRAALRNGIGFRST